MALLNELNEYIRLLPGSRYDVIRNDDLVKTAAININVLDYLDKKNNEPDSFNFLMFPEKKGRNLFVFIKFINFKKPQDNGYMMIVLKQYTDQELASLYDLANKNPNSKNVFNINGNNLTLKKN